jgi:hypothetical protein
MLPSGRDGPLPEPEKPDRTGVAASVEAFVTPPRRSASQSRE